MKKFFSQYGVYAIALVCFAALAFIYCSPVFEGKVLHAGDNDNYKGAVHEVAQYQKDSGDASFWTGSMFCGMPTYQIGACKYKTAQLMKPLKKILFIDRSGVSAPQILILYFICFFILLRCFDANEWISIAGAIAITMSSYFLVIIPAGHITKTTTIALVSVVIGGFHLIFKKKYWWGIILTAVPCALGFTKHPQMSYYIFMLIGTLYIAELYNHIKEKRLKDFAIGTLLFVLSTGIGIGANCSNVFANSEYVAETMRGGHSDIVSDTDNSNRTSGLDLAYATQWSYGIGESLSFLIPGINGGASSVNVGTESDLYKTLVSKGVDKSTAAQFCQGVPLYWGDQPFTSGNVYMGAAVCFLFVLGLIIVKGSYKWALAFATLMSVALAWGSNWMPLTELFFNHFPMYDKFRTVSSILIVAEITMPLLGFMAIREIVSGEIEQGKAMKGIYISAGITAGICLIVALFGKMMFSFKGVSDASYAAQLPDFVYNGIIAERKSLLVTDSFRSLLFILLSAAVLWLYTKGILKGRLLALALAIIIVADMWPVDRRYFNDSSFISRKQDSGKFEMLPYERQILSDTDPHFRVLNLTTSTFNDARTSYYLKSLGGYSAAKLRRYQDLIDQHISKMNMNVISMLNAKYIITEGENGQPAPLRNTMAMGNAWYVDTLMIVDNANAESDALNNIDLHTTAVLDKKFADFAGNAVRHHDDEASVRLTEYTPRYIDYESNSSEAGTIVFSEIYYPYGWKASIDGTPVEHFRADYALRALNVPAGQHKIHFEFAPDSVRKGDTIGIICMLLIYAAIAAAIISAVLNRRREGVK